MTSIADAPTGWAIGHDVVFAPSTASGSAIETGGIHGNSDAEQTHGACHSLTSNDKTPDSDGSDSLLDFDDLEIMDPSIPAVRLLQRNGHIGDLSIPSAAEEADVEEALDDDPGFTGLVDSGSEVEDAVIRPRDVEAACRRVRVRR